MTLHINYRYVLEWARTNASVGAQILDYGCGGGDVVDAGRREGLDIHGVELFYAGSGAREIAEERGLLGTAVHELQGGFRIPFPDASFDLVVTNQVLEHVEDLDVVLDEIRRVLRRNGRLLALFPSKSVLREGHIGIPFVHWFTPGSRARERYTRTFRSLGLGYFKRDLSVSQWTNQKLSWLDEFTFYRSRSEIHGSFGQRFTFRHAEASYATYRLKSMSHLRISQVAGLRVVSPVTAALVRGLSGYVIEAVRRA